MWSPKILKILNSEKGVLDKSLRSHDQAALVSPTWYYRWQRLCFDASSNFACSKNPLIYKKYHCPCTGKTAKKSINEKCNNFVRFLYFKTLINDFWKRKLLLSRYDILIIYPNDIDNVLPIIFRCRGLVVVRIMNIIIITQSGRKYSWIHISQFYQEKKIFFQLFIERGGF